MISYPADANINAVLGLMMTFGGRAADALPYIDKAIELNRLEAYSGSFYFFKMMAAYVDQQYDVAQEAYNQHFALETSTGSGPQDRRIICRRNCLAYAAAIKLELARKPTLAPEEQARLTTEAKTLASQLAGEEPEYLGRFPAWKSLFKNPQDGQRAEDDLKAAMGMK